MVEWVRIGWFSGDVLDILLHLTLKPHKRARVCPLDTGCYDYDTSELMTFARLILQTEGTDASCFDPNEHPNRSLFD